MTPKHFAVRNLTSKIVMLENMQDRVSDVVGGWLNAHKY